MEEGKTFIDARAVSSAAAENRDNVWKNKHKNVSPVTHALPFYTLS